MMSAMRRGVDGQGRSFQVRLSLILSVVEVRMGQDAFVASVGVA